MKPVSLPIADQEVCPVDHPWRSPFTALPHRRGPVFRRPALWYGKVFVHSFS
jgi:hypothetical protein